MSGNSYDDPIVIPDEDDMRTSIIEHTEVSDIEYAYADPDNYDILRRSSVLREGATVMNHLPRVPWLDLHQRYPVLYEQPTYDITQYHLYLECHYDSTRGIMVINEVTWCW